MNWTGVIFFIALGGLLGILTQKIVHFVAVARARTRAENIIEEAKKIAQNEDIDEEKYRSKLDQFKKNLTENIENLKDNLEQRNKRLDSLEERVESRKEMLHKNNNQLEEQRRRVEDFQNRLKDTREQYINRLEEKSGDDRKHVLKSLTNELTSDTELTARRMIDHYENAIETRQDQIANHILGWIIPRCDIENPTDISTAALKFPDTDAFEQFVEFFEEHEDSIVELIQSDVRIEPDEEMAVVETLEPVQKEIAHRTLNNIIQQKKFYFELVEDGIERYTNQVENQQKRAAREAMNDCRIDNVPEHLQKLLGVLEFRTSYGQHQLTHSREVAHLGCLMAHEIGADVERTRRAGLLHDIGKAVDRQRERGHAVIGADIAEEEGEGSVVVNAIGSHHGDIEPNSVESVLVAAADAISGSRPGARRENVTNYSERIQSLLELAQNRMGVKKVYAMNAGRELRIRVNRNQIMDNDMEKLAKEIAHDIEDELTYSGEIKINTIRETQITQIAHSE